VPKKLGFGVYIISPDDEKTSSPFVEDEIRA
jgi:hypothetical protein